MTYPTSQVVPAFVFGKRELSRFPGADRSISLQERFRSRREMSIFLCLNRTRKKNKKKWRLSIHSMYVLIQGIRSHSAAIRTAMPSDFYPLNISASSLEDVCTENAGI
ncbi:hypothetical protein CDAR_527851 [Caerostris darwini]|uniref:Uncharacterized protein n=1 Tax=Caerostris darwini TaxID=1538125 RepID=A0AAV4MFE4_9ARAC|nr:hypothetical protein CDAR_527851 [Caerostris darwini]